VQALAIFVVGKPASARVLNYLNYGKKSKAYLILCMRTNAIKTLFLFFVSAQFANAQLLNLPEGNHYGVVHKFNARVIADNQINEIKCTIERKPDGARISKSFQSEIYRFDSLGRTNYRINTNTKLNDSLVTVFTYAGDKLDCEVKNDAAGMYSYCYVYDNEGRITQQKYGRRPAKFEESRSTDISTEHYEHIQYENQHHTTLYNAAGRPYQKEIRYYDENGYLIRYLKTFVMSHARLEETYSYEAHGWLSEKTVDDGSEAFTLKYEYDPVGNLLSETKFIGDKKQYRKEFVYDPKTMLIKAELKRDEIEQMIIIVNYDYTFESSEG
jgi:hypothetical protein